MARRGSQAQALQWPGATLYAAKGQIEERLWRGDEALRLAEAHGEHRPDWEALWLRLLARYTAVCDALGELEERPGPGASAQAA